MCGIFAYLNHNVTRDRRFILEILFNGLRRLEYRGYDSAGISIDPSSQSFLPSDPNGQFSNSAPPPLVFRQEGNIESLVKSVYKGSFLFLLCLNYSGTADQMKMMWELFHFWETVFEKSFSLF